MAHLCKRSIKQEDEDQRADVSGAEQFKGWTGIIGGEVLCHITIVQWVWDVDCYAG